MPTLRRVRNNFLVLIAFVSFLVPYVSVQPSTASPTLVTRFDYSPYKSRLDTTTSFRVYASEVASGGEFAEISSKIGSWCLALNGSSSNFPSETYIYFSPKVWPGQYSEKKFLDNSGCFNTSELASNFDQFFNDTEIWLSFDTKNMDSGRYGLAATVTNLRGEQSEQTHYEFDVHKGEFTSSAPRFSQPSIYQGQIEVRVLMHSESGLSSPSWLFFVDKQQICTVEWKSWTNRVACSFLKGPKAPGVQNGPHLARLVFQKDLGNSYQITDGFSFNSQLVESPVPELGDADYSQSTWKATLRVMQKNNSALGVTGFECFVDESETPVIEKTFTLSSPVWSCHPNEIELPAGRHQIKMILYLANGSEVERIYEVNSTLLQRTLPKLEAFTFSQSGDYSTISVNNKSGIDYAKCVSFQFFFGGVTIEDVDSFRANSKRSFDYETSYLKKFGAQRIEARCTTAGNRVVSIAKNVFISSTPPKVEWAAEPDAVSYASGKYATVSGRIIQNGGIQSKVANLRSWQYPSGWTRWKKIKIDAFGAFRSSIKVSSSTKVQLSIPKTSHTPAKVSNKWIDVYGKVTISSSSSVRAKNYIPFTITVSPSYIRSVDCTETREVYEDADEPITWNRNFSVPIRNGRGLYRGIYLYSGSETVLSCEIGGSAGQYFLGGHPGTRRISIY